MTDFLRLPHWEVQAVHEHAGGYCVDAAHADQPACCIRCGTVEELYRHGTISHAVNDTTHAGEPVVIDWQRHGARRAEHRRTAHPGQGALHPDQHQ